MGELYLCSRTDILRNLYIDTGRTICVIGAPRDFIDWIEKVLPMDARIVPDIRSIDGRGFDILLKWTDDNGPKVKEVDDLALSLNEDGDLWMVVPISLASGIYDGLDIEEPEFSRELFLTLTPMRMIVPLILNSRHDQKSPSLD